MRFDQFHALKDRILFGRSTIEEPSHSNFSYYLMCRYISMVAPMMAVYINEVCNKNDLSTWFSDEVEQFKYLDAIVPKIGFVKSEYIKKTSTEEFKKTPFSDEDVENVAKYFEISKREVRDALTMAYANQNKKS